MLNLENTACLFFSKFDWTLTQICGINFAKRQSDDDKCNFLKLKIQMEGKEELEVDTFRDRENCKS